jgi:hypothetical protein
MGKAALGRYRPVAALVVCQPSNLRRLADRQDSANSRRSNLEPQWEFFRNRKTRVARYGTRKS